MDQSEDFDMQSEKQAKESDAMRDEDEDEEEDVIPPPPMMKQGDETKGVEKMRDEDEDDEEDVIPPPPMMVQGDETKKAEKMNDEDEEDKEKPGDVPPPLEVAPPARTRPRRAAADRARERQKKGKKADASHYLGYINDEVSVDDIMRQFAELEKRQNEKGKPNEELDPAEQREFFMEHADFQTRGELEFLQEMEFMDRDDDKKDESYDFGADMDLGDDDMEEFVDYPALHGGVRQSGRKKRSAGANLSLLKSMFPYQSFSGRFFFQRSLNSTRTIYPLLHPTEDTMAEVIDPAQIRNIVFPKNENTTQEDKSDDDFPETFVKEYSYTNDISGKENWIEIKNMYEYDDHVPNNNTSKRKKKGKKKGGRRSAHKKYRVVYITAPKELEDENFLEDLDIGGNSRFNNCYLYVWLRSDNFQSVYVYLRTHGFKYVESVTWLKLDKTVELKNEKSDLESMQERADESEVLYMFKKNPHPMPRTGNLFRKHQRWVDILWDFEKSGRPHYYALRLMEDLNPIALDQKEVLWIWGDRKYIDHQVTRRMDIMVEEEEEEEENNQLVDEDEDEDEEN